MQLWLNQRLNNDSSANKGGLALLILMVYMVIIESTLWRMQMKMRLSKNLVKVDEDGGRNLFSRYMARRPRRLVRLANSYTLCPIYAHVQHGSGKKNVARIRPLLRNLTNFRFTIHQIKLGLLHLLNKINYLINILIFINFN